MCSQCALWGHLRGREAGAEGFPSSHPSRVGEDREGTPEILCPQLCWLAAAEACTPVLLSSLLRTSPGSGSKIPKQGKKEKARGRGRCRLQRPPSPPVGRQQRCYWRRGAARGRLRGGPRLSAGSAADGPESRLGRRLLHRRRSRRRVPAGLHDLREGLEARSLISACS